MNKSNHSNHICDICNKEYTNRQNLWRHKKTHIKTYCKSTVSQNEDFGSHPPIIVSQKTAILDLHKASNVIIEKIGYSCEFCGTIYVHRQSKYKHQIKCRKKTNENITLKTQLLEKEKENLQKQLDDIKKVLMDVMNKNCKIHPKTLQKINKQLNGDHNTINENINKGTINNTYNIIALGHENLTDVFSKKEKMAILKYRYCSLPHLVEYTHFNDKYPQFKNILITNTQNKLAYRYDIKKKQFIAVDKDELLENIVDSRMCDINSFYEELEEELDTKTKEILDKVKDKIENEPAYKLLKKQDIKLIIYNNRKKVSKEVSDNLEIEV